MFFAGDTVHAIAKTVLISSASVASVFFVRCGMFNLHEDYVCCAIAMVIMFASLVLTTIAHDYYM